MGYRSDSIAVSRDVGPLRAKIKARSEWKLSHSYLIHMSGGANYLPKFLPILFFRRASRFIGVSVPIRKILVYAGMLPCLVPSWPQSMQLRISFRSCSDLVLGRLTMPWIFFLISFFRRVSRL